jgi:hypothetical protein
MTNFRMMLPYKVSPKTKIQQFGDATDMGCLYAVH